MRTDTRRVRKSEITGPAEDPHPQSKRVSGNPDALCAVRIVAVSPPGHCGGKASHLSAASPASAASIWIRLIVVVSGLAMLLSLAGIYSVMSITVAQRTREIGVRVALRVEPSEAMSTDG